MTSIVVAGGIIWQDDHLLAALRPQGKPMAGYWEFPGGKLEPGETAEQALCRELREELGIGSIEILTLVADLEDVFRITVRERDLREVETVADVVQLVLRLKENQS